MSIPTLRALLLGFALVTPAATWADEPKGTPPEQLGTVTFANPCADAVQPELQRAVKLLHSFWWEEGERAFRGVLERDPGCAIATWGIASILLGNTFSPGPTPAQAQAANEAIAKGRALGAKTQPQRLYIQAIRAPYHPLSPPPQRAPPKSPPRPLRAPAPRFPHADPTPNCSPPYPP